MHNVIEFYQNTVADRKIVATHSNRIGHLAARRLRCGLILVVGGVTGEGTVLNKEVIGSFGLDECVVGIALVASAVITHSVFKIKLGLILH